MYTKPGDAVLDVFSGTGTAPLQACLDGRIGIGNDISPEAYMLTAAKVDPPTPAEFFEYLIRIRRKLNSSRKKIDADDNELYFGSDFLRQKLNLRLYYHRETLVQLLKLRSILLEEAASASKVDLRNARFCLALVLGILHGDRPESLSLPLDRSKSLTTNHIKKMQHDYPGKYETKNKDVIECIALKAEKTFRHEGPSVRGQAFKDDAVKFSCGIKAKLVITSPPYYNAHTYAYDNRHRLWFLGYDYQKVQRGMFQISNQSEYSSYLMRCVKNIQSMLTDDSACVLVVGDVEMGSGGGRNIVETGEQIALEWQDLGNTEMEVARIIVDPIPLKSRRYIHVPITKGIKQERIVVFHKGRPNAKESWIDWTQRPFARPGPDWASLYK
jgi:site-specific DNA-methyltransferase (adenine-specific)